MTQGRVRDVPFVIDHVRVVRQTDLGWTCEIRGRTVFIGRLQVVPGSAVPEAGRDGQVTLTAAAARDLGLLDLATAAAALKTPPRRH
jgi:hypothetical protein